MAGKSGGNHAVGGVRAAVGGDLDGRVVVRKLSMAGCGCRGNQAGLGMAVRVVTMAGVAMGGTHADRGGNGWLSRWPGGNGMR